MKMVSVRQAILIVLLAACLLGASHVLPYLDRARVHYQTATIVGSEALPPEIVLLTHLLGGFKSLLVDVVWLRATKLQDDQQFWELNQLYDWMGKLDPHSEAIWVNLAWNMAFNISVELDDGEGRWTWVKRGIELLRNQGLKYNPNSAKIMKEIAWIYSFKIGRYVDLYSAYYKHQLAAEMHMVLGPRELQDIPDLAEAQKRWPTLEKLLEDPDVAQGLQRFQLDPPEEIVRTIDTVDSPLKLAAPIMNSIRKHGTTDCRKKIRHYISARILRDKYKMANLDVMAGMEKEYGKFDWRLPEPYAIYWSWIASQLDRDPNNIIEYDRMILYGLQETMRRGQVVHIPPNPSEPLVLTFDLSKIEPLNETYHRLILAYPRFDGPRGGDSLRDGHRQFLKEATLQLYFAGYPNRALEKHKELFALYHDPSRYIPMEAYVLGQVEKLVNEYGTEARVRGELVDPLIYRTCFALCTNKVDEARNYENFARRAWKAFYDYEAANADDRIDTAKTLPSFEAIERDIVRAILLGRMDFPKTLIPVLRGVLNLPPNWEKEQGRLDVRGGLAPPVKDDADADSGEPVGSSLGPFPG